MDILTNIKTFTLGLLSWVTTVLLASFDAITNKYLIVNCDWNFADLLPEILNEPDSSTSAPDASSPAMQQPELIVLSNPTKNLRKWNGSRSLTNSTWMKQVLLMSLTSCKKFRNPFPTIQLPQIGQFHHVLRIRKRISSWRSLNRFQMIVTIVTNNPLIFLQYYQMRKRTIEVHKNKTKFHFIWKNAD